MSTLKVDGIRSNSATSDAITLAGDGTCTAKITNNLSNRNLIINGAMQVAQRGTSSTSGGYQTVDRFPSYHTGGAVTQSQGSLTSGSPFEKGFTKYFRITNTTANTGTDGARSIIPKLEAQDIANSGWNYKSSSSYITLSFWVRSSVNQEFYILAQTQDGTKQAYPFSIGTLSENTWTKVTHSIPGNSNITMDNNTENGLQFFIYAFLGTDFTSSSVSLNAWGAYSSSARTPDYTNTWAATTNATFDITGLQLEVGSVATDFEHRSFGQELALCTRYLQIFHVPSSDSYRATGITATVHGGGNGVYINTPFLPMRAAPSLTVDGAFGGNVFTGGWTGDTLSSFSAGFVTDPLSTYGFHGVTSATISSSRTTGLTGHIYTANNGSNDAALIYSAEL